jgi:hypothetical protein
MTDQDQPRRLRLRKKEAEPVALRPQGAQPPVSEKLRAARQAKGLDFFRIERDTKIRTRFLEAIEDGRFEDLPGEIYARGFIRNYAAYLGLNADAVEAQWRVETGQPAPPPLTPKIKPTPREFVPQPMPEPVAPPEKPAREKLPEKPPEKLPEKPPEKPARQKKGPAETAEAVPEIAGGGRSLPRPSLPRPKLPALPAFSLPALKRPVLHAPSLGLPSSRRGEAEGEKRPNGSPAAKERSIGRPEPMTEPGRRLLLQPSHIVLLAMAAVVVLVAGYFAVQVTRVLDYPTIAVTDPERAVTTLSPGTAQYVLAGTATPGSTVRISWDEREPNTVLADETGKWEFETPLHNGLNQFDISARNEATNHNSDEVTVIVEVPVPTASPTPKLLVIESPAEGERLKAGDVKVEGTAVGLISVTITPTKVGLPPAPGSTPRPSPTPGAPTEVPTMIPLPSLTPTPEGQTPTPRPTPNPTPTPDASNAPEPVTVIPTVDGKFSAVLELMPGTWKITAVGWDSDGQATAPVEVTVGVPTPPLQVTIQIKGGTAWLKIWKDGSVLPGYSKEFPSGTVIPIEANESVWIRTGSAVKTYVTVNGTAYGPLGGARSGSWRITALGPPVPSQDI